MDCMPPAAILILRFNSSFTSAEAVSAATSVVVEESFAAAATVVDAETIEAVVVATIVAAETVAASEVAETIAAAETVVAPEVVVEVHTTARSTGEFCTILSEMPSSIMLTPIQPRHHDPPAGAGCNDHGEPMDQGQREIGK